MIDRECEWYLCTIGGHGERTGNKTEQQAQRESRHGAIGEGFANFKLFQVGYR